jgi:hypothetical protein
MNKNKIIGLLEKGKMWEDEFILKYDAEVVWQLLKTLPKNKFEKIKPLLEENISESKEHAKKIEEIITNIKSGKYEL